MQAFAHDNFREFPKPVKFKHHEVLKLREFPKPVKLKSREVP